MPRAEPELQGSRKGGCRDCAELPTRAGPHVLRGRFFKRVGERQKPDEFPSPERIAATLARMFHTESKTSEFFTGKPEPDARGARERLTQPTTTKLSATSPKQSCAHPAPCMLFHLLCRGFVPFVKLKDGSLRCDISGLVGRYLRKTAGREHLCLGKRNREMPRRYRGRLPVV